MAKIFLLFVFLSTLSSYGISQIISGKNTDIIIKRIRKSLSSITRIQNESSILYTGFKKSGVFSFYSQSGHLEAPGNYNHKVFVGKWSIQLCHTNTPANMVNPRPLKAMIDSITVQERKVCFTSIPKYLLTSQNPLSLT